MAVTNATFRAQFPEFDKAPDSAIDSALTRAALRVNADVWDSVADDGIALLAAHLYAATDPGGAFARFADGPSIEGEPLSTTRYGVEFVALRDALAAGPGVY